MLQVTAQTRHTSVGRRLISVASATVMAGSLLIATAGPALAAAPSTQDTTYLTSNIQTSLAEIAIGNLALSKSQDPGVRDLANMTITDHTAALQKATTVANQVGIPVPTEPSADQKADAAKLTAAAGSDFNSLYAQIQVAGHTKSVASTNTEISSGSDPAVVTYAKEYLPVASMHLTMSQELLTALGATPSAVPAGNGGMAATNGATPLGIALTLTGALLLLVVGFYLLRRRSRATD